MARMQFNSVFTTHEDGSLEPLQRVRIGGVTMGPGARFGNGVSFSGVNISQFIDRDLEVETDGQILVIKGIY